MWSMGRRERWGKGRRDLGSRERWGIVRREKMCYRRE